MADPLTRFATSGIAAQKAVNKQIAKLGPVLPAVHRFECVAYICDRCNLVRYFGTLPPPGCIVHRCTCPGE